MLFEGGLKWLQSILDPANALYDFLIDKVLSLQTSVEFSSTWHTGQVLVLLSLIEGHRIATSVRGPDWGPWLWGSLSNREARRWHLRCVARRASAKSWAERYVEHIVTNHRLLGSLLHRLGIRCTWELSSNIKTSWT